MDEALTFDDVLIEPGYSDIITRSHIDLAQDDFLGLRLLTPIISANMDYVTGYEMASEMWNCGGLGILNRFQSWEEQDDAIMNLYQHGKPAFISVGTRDIDETMRHINQVEYQIKGICIDIAHGHHYSVNKLIREIRDNYGPGMPVIAGNVATEDGFKFLADAGADAIKVGIGPGSVCTTRSVTGVGVPQFTAIQRAWNASLGYDNIKIIADGGIKNSGDIVKALAIGADAVMLGSLLAGTDECPGETRVAPDNSHWRPYQGQSIFGVNETKYTPEGISGWVKSKGPVANVLKQLAGGIRSGMSYVGARNIKELQDRAKFVRVSSYAHIESGTRIVQDF